MLTYVVMRSEINYESVKDGGSSVEGEDSNEKKLVLALFSKLYSKLEVIPVSASKHSFYFILYYLLTISTTNYCLKENVHNFVLRRMFYSRQGLKILIIL